MKRNLIYLIFILMAAFFVSCNKQEEREPMKDTSAVNNESQRDNAAEAPSAPVSAETQMNEADNAEFASLAPGAGILSNNDISGHSNFAAGKMQTGGTIPDLHSVLRADTSAPADKKFIRTGEIKFRVGNVHKATETIEDLAAKYAGFVVSSDLKHSEEAESHIRVAKDTVALIKKIVVNGEIKLRVPADKLDSFVRELNGLLVFLDYRILRREDVTLKFVSLQKEKDRLQNYERRQKRNIDSKSSNLETKTYAEDALLNKQMQQDGKEIQKMDLEDQVKYATLSVSIYQAPVVATENTYDFEYIEDLRPGFFERTWGSIVMGWHGVEEVVIALFAIWPLFILLVICFYIYKVIRNKRKK